MLYWDYTVLQDTGSVPVSEMLLGTDSWTEYFGKIQTQLYTIAHKQASLYWITQGTLRSSQGMICIGLINHFRYPYVATIKLYLMRLNIKHLFTYQHILLYWILGCVLLIVLTEHTVYSRYNAVNYVTVSHITRKWEGTCNDMPLIWTHNRWHIACLMVELCFLSCLAIYLEASNWSMTQGVNSYEYLWKRWPRY